MLSPVKSQVPAMHTSDVPSRVQPHFVAFFAACHVMHVLPIESHV
jgi:hypothetical protein